MGLLTLYVYYTSSLLTNIIKQIKILSNVGSGSLQGKRIKNALQTEGKRLSLGFLSGESDDWQFHRAFLGVARPPN